MENNRAIFEAIDAARVGSVSSAEYLTWLRKQEVEGGRFKKATHTQKSTSLAQVSVLIENGSEESDSDEDQRKRALFRVSPRYAALLNFI